MHECDYVTLKEKTTKMRDAFVELHQFVEILGGNEAVRNSLSDEQSKELLAIAASGDAALAKMDAGL